MDYVQEHQMVSRWQIVFYSFLKFKNNFRRYFYQTCFWSVNYFRMLFIRLDLRKDEGVVTVWILCLYSVMPSKVAMTEFDLGWIRRFTQGATNQKLPYIGLSNYKTLLNNFGNHLNLILFLINLNVSVTIPFSQVF